MTMSLFFSGSFAFFVPSNISVRMQQRIATKTLSMASSVDNIENSASLLNPNVVSSKVFSSSDRRPVILFDGGKFLRFADFSASRLFLYTRSLNVFN